jgi:hypothetical protein
MHKVAGHPARIKKRRKAKHEGNISLYSCNPSIALERKNPFCIFLEVILVVRLYQAVPLLG